MLSKYTERQTNVKLDVNLTGGKDRFPMGIVSYWSYWLRYSAGGRIWCVYMDMFVTDAVGVFGVPFVRYTKNDTEELNYARIVVYMDSGFRL